MFAKADLVKKYGESVLRYSCEIKLERIWINDTLG